jgi:hypothetical protein
MANLNWDGAAYVRRLQTEHAYHVSLGELCGEEKTAAFRTVQRREAKAAGANDPGPTPSTEELRAAALGAATATCLSRHAPRATPLRMVD